MKTQGCLFCFLVVSFPLKMDTNMANMGTILYREGHVLEWKVPFVSSEHEKLNPWAFVRVLKVCLLEEILGG